LDCSDIHVVSYWQANTCLQRNALVSTFQKPEVP
jgi:hypothetical protein